TCRCHAGRRRQDAALALSAHLDKGWSGLETGCAPSYLFARRNSIGWSLVERPRHTRPSASSGFQRPVEKRQAGVHPVIDIGVVIVEFLVDVPDAGGCQTLGQDARAELDVVLVAPA